MTENLKYKIDLHTHTSASGHAYCSLKEMAKTAAEKGLEWLGFAEHAPAMPGSCHPLYFINYHVIPDHLYGIRILKGAELNVLDFQGSIDLEMRGLLQLDFAIASLHTRCFKSGTRTENTDALLHAMENPFVNIIGHPDDSRYPLDYERLVKGALANGVLLELNASSLDPENARKNGPENDRLLLKTCEKYGAPILLGSDAHFDDMIGNFGTACSLLEELEFPEALVMNGQPEKLKTYLNRWRNKTE